MYGLVKAVLEAFIQGKKLLSAVTTSSNYKHWISFEDLRRCIECKDNHRKIYRLTETPNPSPPAHPNCRCRIEAMKTIRSGTATINGKDGADWKLLFEGTLPDYYITKDDAAKNGWKRGKYLSNFLPGKMMTKGNYDNRNGHLPFAPNRQWYEADINYTTGKRGSQRVLWSDDGLIFVTYDHYHTFYEITGE